MDVRPSDRVLEIGPGPGVSVALIAERLEDGRLVAIDRSAVAVQRTAELNRPNVEAGIVHPVHTSLEDFDGRGGPFDKVLAVNVNLFWVRDATADLDRIATWLTPRGRLYLVYEAPSPQKEKQIATRVREQLQRSAWSASTRSVEGILGFVAQPNRRR